jgi:hypothetical protein
MKHLVVPDCQVKPGVDIEYLERIGKYIVEKQPEKIICLGDFADMPSLSSYDVGKKSFEGRRYIDDVAATKRAMATLLGPLNRYNDQRRKNKSKQYTPELHLTLGNHENRIVKAVENDAKLEGVLSTQDLGYAEAGWKVYPFLEIVVIDGIAYSHYFTSGVMGRPVPNARQLAVKKHMSCVMGHVQNWDMNRDVRGDGKPIITLFAGSCYTHNEDYLGPQGNTYDRGLWMFHEVNEGHFMPMYVSLGYLERKYG